MELFMPIETILVDEVALSVISINGEKGDVIINEEWIDHYTNDVYLKRGLRDNVSELINDAEYVSKGDNVSDLTNDAEYVSKGDNVSDLTNDAEYVSKGDNVSDLTNDAEYVSKGDNVSDLTNDAEYVSKGDNVSDLTNDAEYVSKGDNVSDLTNDAEYVSKGDNVSDLTNDAEYVSKGDNVSDLTNDVEYVSKGDNVSDLTNDAEYVSKGDNVSDLTNDAEYVTQKELNDSDNTTDDTLQVLLDQIKDLQEKINALEKCAPDDCFIGDEDEALVESAKFLQMTTFGPTWDEITNFDPNNKEEWMDNQIMSSFNGSTLI